MQHENNGLTRRQFIKVSAGTVGTLALTTTLLNKALGRARADSSQPDTGSANGKARAWCMVIDLKKCEGCVTIDSPPQCTQACINGHFVPKGQQWIQVFEAEQPGGGKTFMPTPCYQCENAPCVNVCPVAATYHSKDGVVLVDHRRCIGCRMCMAACPYQRRFFNWGTPELPANAAFAEYSPFYPVPAVKGTVIKCMFCAHLLEDGKLPLCVMGCPMKALYMGDRNENIASNGVEVVELSRLLGENDAFQYKEDLGTQPRVFYLPGHGQNFGREASDHRPLKEPVWGWGGEGFEKRPDIFTKDVHNFQHQPGILGEASQK
ncbi:MAG: 4Fe-4S dicluster domain-containing protein [Chloroflexi bacterium]|nr:4Fe-4S dicluster domain-containing protein [Chloroflexota bacterium]